MNNSNNIEQLALEAYRQKLDDIQAIAIEEAMKERKLQQVLLKRVEQLIGRDLLIFLLSQEASPYLKKGADEGLATVNKAQVMPLRFISLFKGNEDRFNPYCLVTRYFVFLSPQFRKGTSLECLGEAQAYEVNTISKACLNRICGVNIRGRILEAIGEDLYEAQETSSEGDTNYKEQED
ncbi:hypothetical protein [Roseofilum sp. Belize Diploria]|uniref:hypothetical protein n=1 Tax=Roseofilum sp. Belize Diploria TaxID=2821501 RepID=UPI001B1D02FC|nr:hypothetical protein [Roseofilum sp. Belize Diploria]MBP0011294.1 hypothetical protein [Roseofilum sp. Belize Diploria]